MLQKNVLFVRSSFIIVSIKIALLFPLAATIYGSFFVPNVFSETKQFTIATDIIYSIADEGTSSVTQRVHIKNKTEYMYTPTYTFSPALRDIENVKIVNDNGKLPFEILTGKNGQKSIKITFKHRTTGTSKTNDFVVSYTTHDIAKRLGQIWQISIPGVSDPSNYESYTAVVRVPQSFGNASVFKPQPFSHMSASSGEDSKNEIVYSKNDIKQSGIFLEFGGTQYYSFTLQYHLENPNFFPINSEVALPPATNYQDISIEKLNPQPSNVTQDANGNWIAVYKLVPHERQDIILDGVAKIYSHPRTQTLSNEEMKTNLADKQYWEVNDSGIQKIANTLKTSEKIYEYVRTHLTYNYSKVTRDNKRLGAYGVLHDTKYAVCLEFTDLFIALARAAHIPAREVEGYAYTQNQTLKPLSATRDILHTWPEYYDSKKQAWIAVDPTWGNTTNGADYFNSMDFEHITFVINGDNSTYPIPAGGYKLDPQSKDILVTFADSQSYKESSRGEIIDDLPQNSLSGFGITGQVLIKNHGTTPLPNFEFIVDSALSPNHKTYSVQNVPPYGTLAVPVHFDGTPFLTNAPYLVTIHSGSSKLTHTIAIGYIPDRSWIIIGGVLLIGIAILFIITTKTRRLFIPRHKR